jgi:hypothetical protein
MHRDSQTIGAIADLDYPSLQHYRHAANKRDYRSVTPMTRVSTITAGRVEESRLQASKEEDEEDEEEEDEEQLRHHPMSWWPACHPGGTPYPQDKRN